MHDRSQSIDQSPSFLSEKQQWGEGVGIKGRGGGVASHSGTVAAGLMEAF